MMGSATPEAEEGAKRLFCRRAVVERPERQRLLFVGQYLHSPSAAQGPNQRYRRLRLAGQ
jgi:hypothetical protein